MKPLLNRLLVAWCLCSMIAAVTLTACGGGEEAMEEQAAEEPADENLTVRQTRMRQISAICGGINQVLKEGSVENIASDAQQLKEIMAEVATIPPPFDTEKYKFYAADFQAKADTLMMAAETGSVDNTRPVFLTLTETCGVCHYTCKYPVDL